MNVFIVLEMADVEVLSVEVFASRPDALNRYVKLRDDNLDEEWRDEEMDHEVAGIIYGAGDDSHAVVMLYLPVQ